MKNARKVKDMMCTSFKIIRPDTTLREAAQHMCDHDCGYLPVGENDRLSGAVTDRDIVVRGIARGHDPEITGVDQVMTEKVVYCFEGDDVDEAAALMKREQIRRLVVLSEQKRMVGILTVGDIARASQDTRLTGDIELSVAQEKGREAA